MAGFNLESGHQTRNKLLELGLGWVIDYLSWEEKQEKKQNCILALRDFKEF